MSKNVKLRSWKYVHELPISPYPEPVLGAALVGYRQLSFTRTPQISGPLAVAPQAQVANPAVPLRQTEIHLNLAILALDLHRPAALAAITGASYPGGGLELGAAGGGDGSSPATNAAITLFPEVASPRTELQVGPGNLGTRH